MLSRKTLGRIEIADGVHMRVGLPHSECRELVDKLLRHMSRALSTGEWIQVRGFGTFEVRQKRAREGRNPKTLEPAPVSARRVVCFRPSDILRDRVNEE